MFCYGQILYYCVKKFHTKVRFCRQVQNLPYREIVWRLSAIRFQAMGDFDNFWPFFGHFDGPMAFIRTCSVKDE